MMHSQRQGSRVSKGMQEVWRRLVRLGFRLLYNELAWTYDLVSWLVSRGQWRAWQRATLPHLAGDNVLELAHGPGHMLLELESAGFLVTGLDLSPFMVRQARRRTRYHRERIALVRGKAQALPFTQGSFDNVLVTFPTEFLAEKATINSVYRVLKPGGRLVVVPQAQFTGTSTTTRILEWLYAITGQRPVTSADESRSFWNEIRERFEEVGFVLEVNAATIEASEVTIVTAERPYLS